MPALAAPVPGQLSAGTNVAAPVFHSRVPGFRVPFPVAAALPIAASPAQPPVRLAVVLAAPGTKPSCNPFIGTPAGAPVFGLAGLRVPDAPDACGLALAGPALTGHTAFLQATFALTAARLRFVVTAARADALRSAPFGTQPMPLPVLGASLVGVAVRHGRCLLDRWMDDMGGPAGAGERTRRAPTGGSASAAGSGPRWHGNRSIGRQTSSRVRCKR